MAAPLNPTPEPISMPVIIHKRPSTAWALAAVVITFLLIVGGPIAYIAISWSHAAVTGPDRLAQTFAQAAAEMAKPRIDIHEIVLNSVSDLQKESKLVVMTTNVSTDVTIEEAEASWGIYWGKNVARVAIKDARVQYVIDLNKVNTSDFMYNPEARVLSLSLPKPHVDTKMVAIDPARVETLDLRGGWARFDKQETRDHALAELRPKVILQANAPYVRELAYTQGIEATTQFLQPLASALSQQGATLRVSYRD